MENVATIGLDIAKNVFQVHGADADGEPLFNRTLRRAEVLAFFKSLPPCLVGMEACGTSHYWARCIADYGHNVRLIHPSYVKPFVKRGKTDANDAEAISEAVTRKTMRFVPIKTAEQQASTMVFRVRALFVRQKTQAINALRGHLAEQGIISRAGNESVKALAIIVREGGEHRLPEVARIMLEAIVLQIELLTQRIDELDREIHALAKQDDGIRRLMTIPGIGPITALAVKSFVPDPGHFASSRHFAAWIGLTPKSYSSGDNVFLGRVSKMGNSQLRALLVTGAKSVLRVAKDDDPVNRWANNVKKRRPYRVAAVALANKMARIIWALLTKGGEYTQNRKNNDGRETPAFE